MDVAALTLSDRRLLAARRTEHANSHRRLTAALREAGAERALERARALRALERRFQVDLGSLCWRLDRVERGNAHPIERALVRYITEWREPVTDGEHRPDRSAPGHDDGPVLWVLLDRLREVREFIEEGSMAQEREG